MNTEYEIQPAPLICPKCDQEFDYIEGQWEYTCQKCGHRIDNLEAQFAYSRGYDAFFAGQRVYMEIPPSRRSRLAYAEQAHEAFQFYTQAYTGLQEAFQANLADSQRKKAIEVMASIANLFIQTGLVSPLESNYWTSLMIEQVNRQEYEELEQKLSQPARGILGVFPRLRWQLRKRQLAKALDRVQRKIQQIEQNIAFITPPRVRKGTPGRMGASRV
jgi:hypothetical protein